MKEIELGNLMPFIISCLLPIPGDSEDPLWGVERKRRIISAADWFLPKWQQL